MHRNVPKDEDAMTNITDTSQDDRMMGMIAYVLGFFFPIIGPLIIWLIKKDQSRFVSYHALQALIFTAVTSVATTVAWFLTAVLIGWLLVPVVGIVHLAFCILAAMAANRGEWYEIPAIGKFARQSAGV